MARRFWWFAAAFLLTLIFVTTDCQRRSSNHATVEGQEATIRSRSDLKFAPKAKKVIETTPSPFTTSTRPTRRSAGLSTSKTNSRTTPKTQRGHEKNIGLPSATEKSKIISNKKLENLKKSRQFRNQQPDDLARAATEDRRYLPEIKDNFQSVKENFQSVKVSEEQTNLETPLEPVRSNRGNKNILSRSRNFDSRFFDSSSDNPGLVAPKIQTKPSGRKSPRAERTFKTTQQDSTEASDRGGDVSRASRRHFTERSTRRQESTLPSESTSVSSLPDEGKKLSSRKSSGRSRDLKLNDRSLDTGSSGNNRKTSSRELKNSSIRGRELRAEEGAGKNGEERRQVDESKKKSETLKKLDKMKKQEKLVKLNSDFSTTTFEPESTTGGVLTSTTMRARKIETQEGKPASIGLRKNPGQMQASARRYSSQSDATKSPIVETTESSTISSSTSTEVNFSVTPTRARGSKHFNKASVTDDQKIDQELQEEDNYPEEFKAKLAQLKYANTKNVSTKTSLQPGEGLKQRLAEASSSPRSRSKPPPVRTPTESAEKLKDNLKTKDSSTIVRPIGRSLDLTTEIPNSKSLGASNSDEPKTIKGPTRFGTSRPSSTTSRASVTVTFPTIDKKTTVTSRSITRRSDRVVPDQPQSTTETVQLKSSGPRASLSKENGFTTTTQRSLPTIKKLRPWNSSYIDRNWQEPSTKPSFIERKSTSTTSTTKRPKGWRDSTERLAYQEINKAPTTTTTEVPSTNKYPRWKPGGSSYDEPSTTSRIPLDATPLVRRHEFRPRTATYRRHSELPAPIQNLTEVKDNLSIAITPKVPKYNSSDSTEHLTHRSIRQEPSIEVSNSTVNNNSSSGENGISLSSRGSSGNSDSNIFNPTKATYLISSNASLLEQLRSTVAPLLSALGNKTPIFSGSYSNVHTSNSQPRVTPSGTPPKFSARYRGAELFVRKPNGLEPSGPPSTTPQTLTKDEDTIRSPEIAISSPGEPNVITFYQALETASITNEIDQTTENIKHQKPNIVQVESNKGTAMKKFNVTSNAVNDTSTITEKNLVQANTLATSLSGSKDSQDPGNESTTTNSATQTVTESTASPQNVLNTDFTTVSILNSSEDTAASTPNNVEVSSSTLAPTEISNEIDEIPELMLTTMETPTTTQGEFGVTGKIPSVNLVPDLVEPLQNLIEDVNKNDVTTTFSPEILTTQSSEISTTPTSSTIEVNYSESTMPKLESLAQFTVVPPTTQVIEELQEKLTTVPYDPDFVTMIPTTAFENLNTTEYPELSTDIPSSIDNDVLTMINRLMKILVNDNTTYLNSIQQEQAGIEFDDSGRIVGGFLDNNDNSNITLDVENLNDTLGTNTQFPNLESEKLLTNETTNSTPEQIGTINSTTMASEIQTMLQSDTVNFEQTTPNTNEVNKMLLTTSMPETVETDIPEREANDPGVKIVPELTTNLPTITSTILTPDDTTLLTDEPNVFGDLQDDKPANVQMTMTNTEAQVSTTISPPVKNSSLAEMPSTSPSMSSTTQSTSSSTNSETPMPQTSTIPAVKTSPSNAGRFGGSRITPAPKFSASSSTRQPLRDYHVYGIYPNKTIVRKRPDDNLIDARNVDSPYVIFGIYPDGKLVRKFPNGTVIPDPPITPVEIVFSLSTTTTRTIITTTTTNRPQSNQQFNPSNQILNNWNVTLSNNNQTIGDVNKNPSGPTDDNPSQHDNGLSSNALRPSGNGPNQSNGTRPLLSTIGNVGNQPFSTNMTEVVSDAEMRVSMNTTENISGLLTTAGPPPTTTTTAATTTPSSVNSQGGRIIQDRERDKASRTKEAGGQRSTVYIGQEKFIDYWTDDPPGNNSRVVSVKINSVTNALNGLPGSSNLGSSGSNTASGSLWKDPLDQIFGASVNASTENPSESSNIIDEAVASRFPITESPINPFSEVFTPMLNDAQLAKDTRITTTSGEPSVSAKATTTTSTTTPPPPPSSSSSSTTTTTTTPTPTTTTEPTTTTTTTMKPSTFSSTTTSSTSSMKESLTTPTIPKQTPFGTKFDDLAFLNSLLQPNGHLNSISSTPKTLTEVEQLLANKILSLALANPGPMRSAKAIQPSNSAGNSLETVSNIESPLRPIIIDLLQTTTRNSATVASTTSKPATWKPVTIVTPVQKVQRITEAASSISKSTTVGSSFPTMASRSSTIPVSSTTTQKTWTGFPTLSSVSTTTQNVWTGFPTLPSVSTTTQKTWTGFPTYAPTSSSTTTTPTTTTTARKIVTTRKPAPRPKPTQAPFRFGAGLLQALFGRNIFAQPTTKPSAPRRPVPTTQKPIQTTADTDLPEEDSKFLNGLLNEQKKKPVDDESFLRSILNGQAKIKAPVPSSSSNSAGNNAALLAQLLKSQGIEPSTPANRLREQLQSAGQSNDVTSTVRPKPTATRPRQNSVTNRPQSSTYPAPLFSNFNFGFDRPRQTATSDDPNGGIRNQMLNAAIGATRVFSQFLGAAITGAAKQLQSFVRNSTRLVSESATV